MVAAIGSGANGAAPGDVLGEQRSVAARAGAAVMKSRYQQIRRWSCEDERHGLTSR